MGILKFFRGCLEIRITGAEPEKFLNTLAEENIHFWALKREDALHYRLCIYNLRREQAEQAAVRNFCTMEILRTVGIREWLKRMKKRPILSVGLPLAILCGIFLQNIVLAIDIDGNQDLHEEEILHSLEELGIGIGSPMWNMDQQRTKNQMLNLLPRLSWIGVNQNGCKLKVSVTERRLAHTDRPPYPAGNLVAVRDGVLTDVIVTEGMRLCAPGDTVRKGQVLVSGFEDYGLILKGVCAEGEIYGQTWHTGTVAAPAETAKKVYTGREWRSYSLVIGRKRINLLGNSRISGVTCDKMVDTMELKLPDYRFPVRIEKETCREYQTDKIPIPADQAKSALTSAWETQVAQEMIAGKTESTETSFTESGGLYVLQAESVCRELLSRLMPMENVYEGETDE